MSTKEDWPRPYNVKAYNDGYERIWGKKEPETEPLPPYDPDQCTCFQNPPCGYCAGNTFDPNTIQ